jgi:hypothetical protein
MSARADLGLAQDYLNNLTFSFPGPGSPVLPPHGACASCAWASFAHAPCSATQSSLQPPPPPRTIVPQLTGAHTGFAPTLSPMTLATSTTFSDRHIPHALLTPTRPYSAVLSQQEPKVPLHAQPSRPNLLIIVLLPARCSPKYISDSPPHHTRLQASSMHLSVTCLIPPR